MSIEDADGNTKIVLNTIHEMAFKVLIWIGIVATPAAMGLFWSYGRSIDNHELRLSMLERSNRSGVSQSVNVGSTTEPTAQSVNWPDVMRRGGYTTAEFARLVDKSQSWVRAEIDQQRLSAARANGKDWLVSLSEFPVPAQFAPKSASLAQSAPADH